MNFIERFSHFVINWRVSIIALTVVSALVFGFFLKDVAIDSSSRIWFSKDSKILKNYNDFLAQYGSDEAAIIAFKVPSGVFNRKDLQTIETITHALESMPYFSSVNSLINYPYISLDEDAQDELIIDELVGNVAALNLDDMKKLKAQALQDEALVGALLSSDGKTTIISATLHSTYAFDVKTSIDIANKIKETLKPLEAQGYDFKLMGVPFINSAFMDIALHDSVVFTTIAIVLVMVLLFVMFRSWIGSLFPMLAVIISFIVVLSIQTLLGYKLNSFTANLPLFVVAIGIVHAVHVYWVWASYSKDGHDAKESARFTIVKNFMPVFLTAFTTAIGFASLGISEIMPIRTLGLATASAAMVAFIMSMLFLPAVLSYFNYKRKVPVGYKFIDPTRYSMFIARHDKKIVAISALLFIFFVGGLTQIEVNNNALKYFKKEHPVRQSMEFFGKNLGGPIPFEIIVDSGRQDGVKDAQFLHDIQTFIDTYTQNFDEIQSVSSLVGVLKKIHQKMHGDDKTYYAIPQESQTIAQYLLLYSFSVPINGSIDSGFRHMRLSAATQDASTSRQLEMMAWITQWWEDKGYGATVNGQPSMFANVQPQITNTLIYSLSTALILISITMLFIFKNIKLLGYFLIPNIFPIVAAIGMMGWLSVYVDMGVAISAAIVLGIAVDDAIHFLIKYLEYRKKGYSFEASLEHVMKYTGGAIVLTTIILSVAFMVLSFSSFMPNVYFAITTTSALLVALAANLLLLPALFSLRDKNSKEIR